MPPTEGKEPFRQLRAVLGGLSGLLQEFELARVLDTRLEHFQIAEDDRKQVVEVVRDAAGELPDGLHLLGLAQFLLDLSAGCEVPDEAREETLPGKVNLPDGQFHREHSSILALRADEASNADDAALARALVAFQVPVVLLAVRRRH